MTDVREQDTLPILYSFRRCPYAMRARMALSVSGQQCRLREIVLRDKPPEFIEASAKATVPVLQLPGGTVLEESLEIMHWALGRHDPQAWLPETPDVATEVEELIAACDGDFKHHLDRYKYATRYAEGTDPIQHRTEGTKFLTSLNGRLTTSAYLCGDRPTLADIAIFPFVRQFANTDRAWFDAEPLPALQDWLDLLLSSDLFTSVMKKFPAWKAGDAETMFPEIGDVKQD